MHVCIGTHLNFDIHTFPFRSVFFLHRFGCSTSRIRLDYKFSQKDTLSQPYLGFTMHDWNPFPVHGHVWSPEGKKSAIHIRCDPLGHRYRIHDGRFICHSMTASATTTKNVLSLVW